MIFCEENISEMYVSVDRRVARRAVVERKTFFANNNNKLMCNVLLKHFRSFSKISKNGQNEFRKKKRRRVIKE